ncbi:hypothetical protein ACE198_27280 [Neobacillus sp. KR4-4]|uniref:hypothetical protein n=1 Tax=Neobacillus sp. KR4-4 TaxID=3344872 RepID=UPI0035CBC9B2
MMIKNSKTTSIMLSKVVVFLMLLFIFNELSVNKKVNAASKDDALTSVVNFLNAQKNCNTEDMMKYSEYYLKINNLKDAFSSYCKRNPLQKAKITSLNIIDENIALVSVQSTYKNTLNIRTVPVVKEDGQWKIVMGIPPSGVKALNTTRGEKESEVARLFEDYTNAIKSHDVTKMKTYIKTETKPSDTKIEQHLKAITQDPTPEITTYGIKMITDSLAIAQIETKYTNHSYS